MDGVDDPIDEDITSLICSYPILEGGGKGAHTDGGNIPTTEIGLTVAVNEIAKSLGLKEWTPPSNTKPGKKYSNRQLSIPWTASEQFSIAKAMLDNSKKIYRSKGVDLDLLPKGLRMLALDLYYNAGNHALSSKSGKNETNFIKNLRTLSQSLHQTPQMAFDVMKESMDIISDNGVYQAGLTKRRVIRFNEAAKDYGLPEINQIDFNRKGGNGVVYRMPKESSSGDRQIAFGNLSNRYDSFNGQGFDRITERGI